jgi:hypothetical protein
MSSIFFRIHKNSKDFYVNAYVYGWTAGQYRNYSILLSNIEIFIDYTFVGYKSMSGGVISQCHYDKPQT